MAAGDGVRGFGVMILGRLKTETAASHDAIERVVDVFRPDFDRAAYRRLLSAMLGFYEPTERLLAEVRHQAFAAYFTPRHKTPLLRRDLGALGLSFEEIEELPRCASIPRCRSLAEALGVCYVLEGSTLGGALIARHVERSLGMIPGDGNFFFRPYGEDLGAMWNQTRATLTTLTTDAGSESVVESARETFDRLRSWLEIAR